MEPLHAVALAVALIIITVCASAEVRGLVRLVSSFARLLLVRRRWR